MLFRGMPAMDPFAPKSFRYVEDAGVAAITFTRPDTLNSLTFEVYAELRDLFAALRTRDAVKAVTMTGEGKGFCSGGNVHDIIGKLVAMDRKGVLEFARMTGAVVENIRRCGRPVIAALNGTAAGAGAVIAIACDLRVMAEGAKIAFLFPRVGLCGADMGTAYLLPRIVGLGRASEILLFGDPVPAARALEIGLVNAVVPLDKVVSHAAEWAKRLANGPTLAHSFTKEMLLREGDLGFSDSIEAEAQAQTLLMSANDFKTAYEAFVARREPVFKGN
jgi:enoyl-CoA hydratase/carnithine racemase